jgi:hypothetical protein
MAPQSDDPLLSYLMPKLKGARRDPGSVEVLKALKAGRSLDNAILDTIESLPASETRNLRLWVEEARGLSRERREKADETAADELLIYLDNDEPIYRMKKLIANNLLKKIARGVYDERRAAAAWMPLVERAAKQYAKEYASSEREWSTVFTPATRDFVAKEIADRWYAAAKRGEPDDGLI